MVDENENVEQEHDDDVGSMLVVALAVEKAAGVAAAVGIFACRSLASSPFLLPMKLDVPSVFAPYAALSVPTHLDSYRCLPQLRNAYYHYYKLMMLMMQMQWKMEQEKSSDWSWTKETDGVVGECVRVGVGALWRIAWRILHFHCWIRYIAVDAEAPSRNVAHAHAHAHDHDHKHAHVTMSPMHPNEVAQCTIVADAMQLHDQTTAVDGCLPPHSRHHPRRN